METGTWDLMLKSRRRLAATLTRAPADASLRAAASPGND